MNELQAQLDVVNAQISEEQAKGAQRDQDILAGLEQKQAAILLDMDAEKAKLEQEQAKLVKIQEQEVKVESDPIPIAVAGVDLSQLDPELIQLMELVTKADRRARLVEFNVEVETIQNDHKEQLRQASERESQLKSKHDSLQAIIDIGKPENERLTRENGDLHDHISKLNIEKADAESKRDAAAHELAGLQEAYKVLQEEIQHMRVANVFGEKKAQQVIDIPFEEVNKAQNLVDSLAKKFVSATPIAANWHEVIDEHGNKTVVHTDDLPKEQVLPFQGSNLDQAHVGSSPDIAALTVPAIAEVSTFPTNFPVQTGDAVDRDSTVSEGNAETVSRQEFEELKGKVSYLYRHANISEVA